MILQVYLTHREPAWLQILDQEKLLYQIVPERAAPAPGILLLTGRCHGREAWLQSWGRAGGSFILDAQNEHLAPALARAGKLYRIPCDVKKILADWQSCDKKFILDDFFVTETAAVQQKSKVRKAVVTAIRQAFSESGRPYVHLWYYPGDYRTSFSFRFDLDEYDAADFDTMCGLIERERESITCFPNLGTYAQYPQALRRLKELGVEIGQHGYVHHVYDNYRQNAWNLTRAEEVLSPITGKLRGFSAPHGKWHPSLGRILEERDYLYSSEFCLEYDGFPYYPLLEGRLSKVLQIPTHPVCEGVFLERYGYQRERLQRYFTAVVQAKAAQEEPILFFGHPTRRIGRYPAIFMDLMDVVQELPQVWRVSFEGLARWWRKRQDAEFTFEYRDDKIHLLTGQPAGDFRVEILWPGGRRKICRLEALQPGLGQTRSGAQAFQSQAGAYPVREECVGYSRFKRVKNRIKRFLDWETKTPLGAYSLYEPRNWLKILLRLASGWLK